MPEDNQFYLTVFENNWEAARKIEQAVLPGLTRFISNNSGTKEDAHEIYTEAMGTAFVKYHNKKLNLYKPLPNFIFGIARNLWLKRLEKRKRKFMDLQDEGYIDDVDIEGAIVEHEMRQLFLDKMKKIGDACRKLLELKLDGFKGKEIAKKLGYANEETVRSRQYTCKKKLFEMIKKDSRYRELANVK